MNPFEELLAKARLALEVPAAVSFIQALQALAPDNIPGLAKALRDIAGTGKPWEKSIVDLARLARNYPREFSALVNKETGMKTLKRITLKPEHIRNGYITVLDIENFECALQVEAIGQESHDSHNNLLGGRIETPKKDSYTFMPYLDFKLFLPSVSKEELIAIINHFGSFRHPDTRLTPVEIDGQPLSIHHDFDKEGEALNFRSWFLDPSWSRDKVKWEDDLANFCLIVRFIIHFHNNNPDLHARNSEVPEFFKSREFRLKIVLFCLSEYFGLPVEP